MPCVLFCSITAENAASNRIEQSPRELIVSAHPYGAVMPTSPRPNGQVPPALDDVNDRIRQLMSEPVGTGRTKEYTRLLTLWADLTRAEVDQAA